MNQLQQDIRDFIIEETKDNTTVLNATGHPVPHPDNKRIPIDVLQAYFGEHVCDIRCNNCQIRRYPV